ncbi:hypothetical protein A6302_03022 [Methylobrevis pamukkalensis]|uniref:Uncharacterized protein n=1 Tax=Methylobrevis pamukkalensis TaxID=1439726 RepID=A0A1E3H0L1_9HYPH|nr:hypothetical protein A6302_03022 [Methylobrevis pamukkalensis]
MPASSAMVSASGTSSRISEKSISGRDGEGRVRGTPPKREAIVAMSRSRTKAASEATVIAIRKPGQCGFQRFRPRMSPRARAVTATAEGIVSPRCPPISTIFGRNSPGRAISRPRMSLNCEPRIDTAMPAVKPVTTG